jgi:hypothetical protein
MANTLPTDLNQKFGGYAQYYKNNFKNDEKGDLKYVGDAWSKQLKIWDDNDNLLEEGYVYEFSSKYPVAELAQIIRNESFRHVMKDLPVEDKSFAYKFCELVGLPSEKYDQSTRYKELFVGTQRVFLEGMRVPLPNWASFTDRSGNLTLRFLQRNDPQGMFLGILSKCCQEPKNFAASCAYDGHLNPNAAFAVFEGPEGLIFQSYVWADEDGNVCFDSIESRKKFDYTKQYQSDAEELMMNFAYSLPQGKKCTVGSNTFSFQGVSTKEKLKNPTKTYEIDYVQHLLINFSPSKQLFYTADSERQNLVGVGMNKPDQQNNM